MSRAFWNGWQLWEKLCFILGVSIVIVVVLGLAKLVYNNYRLRKYSKLAASQAALRESLSRSGTGKRNRDADIPFGVRAIESGIEVEGVWISGSNTPGTSAPGSPTLTPTREKPHQPSQPTAVAEGKRPIPNLPHLDMPPPSHNPNSFQTPVPPFAKPTYQPRRSSGLRFSNSQEVGDRDDALATLEGRSSVPRFSQDVSARTGDHRAERSQRSSSWSTTTYGQTHNGFDQPQNAAGPLNSPKHPLHARYQQALHGEPFHFETDTNSPNAEQNEDSKSDSPTSLSGDPFLTPVQTRNWNETPNWLPDEPGVGGAMPLNWMPSEHDEKQRTTSYPDSQFQVRESHVLRKINSGFEILQPGTLDQPRPSGDPNSEKNQSASGKGSSERRHSAKLQKRRGPSV